MSLPQSYPVDKATVDFYFRDYYTFTGSDFTITYSVTDTYGNTLTKYASSDWLRMESRGVLPPVYRDKNDDGKFFVCERVNSDSFNGNWSSTDFGLDDDNFLPIFSERWPVNIDSSTGTNRYLILAPGTSAIKLYNYNYSGNYNTDAFTDGAWAVNTGWTKFTVKYARFRFCRFSFRRNINKL